MFSTGELARYCGVNFRTVLRWIERGTLRAHKLPGRGDHRIQLEDFLEFLAVHRMPVPRELAPARPQVLIVEDEHHMARSMERVLSRAGFAVKTASDGFRAGTLLGTLTPAVITLDLMIPGLSGLDVLSFVRETRGLEHVKILIVSALPEHRLAEAVRAGADGALAKPFENAELVAAIVKLAGVARSDGRQAEFESAHAADHDAESFQAVDHVFSES
jgi:excisionase family DNA binding protein